MHLTTGILSTSPDITVVWERARWSRIAPGMRAGACRRSARLRRVRVKNGSITSGAPTGRHLRDAEVLIEALGPDDRHERRRPGDLAKRAPTRLRLGRNDIRRRANLVAWLGRFGSSPMSHRSHQPCDTVRDQVALDSATGDRRTRPYVRLRL
jgi:hypothetical protein